tara:strand:- start:178 stop:444 length:267 start_codon:yes stop_codon:yes gene_type:complete
MYKLYFKYLIMKNNFKHFVDVLITTICYIGLIVGPTLIVLVILGIADTGQGITDLVLCLVAVIATFVCKILVREAQMSHNRGQRCFLP